MFQLYYQHDPPPVLYRTHKYSTSRSISSAWGLFATSLWGLCDSGCSAAAGPPLRPPHGGSFHTPTVRARGVCSTLEVKQAELCSIRRFRAIFDLLIRPRSAPAAPPRCFGFVLLRTSAHLHFHVLAPPLCRCAFSAPPALGSYLIYFLATFHPRWWFN